MKELCPVLKKMSSFQQVFNTCKENWPENREIIKKFNSLSGSTENQPKINSEKMGVFLLILNNNETGKSRIATVFIDAIDTLMKNVWQL